MDAARFKGTAWSILRVSFLVSSSAPSSSPYFLSPIDSGSLRTKMKVTGTQKIKAARPKYSLAVCHPEAVMMDWAMGAAKAATRLNTAEARPMLNPTFLLNQALTRTGVARYIKKVAVTPYITPKRFHCHT